MKNATETKMPLFIRCFALALSALAAGALVLKAEAADLDGKALAFDRGKGNCLTCHEMKGGDSAGTIGPALSDMKARFSDRKELIAIISDETARNPQTMMPPFGRNLILTNKEIEAIADFLLTL